MSIVREKSATQVNLVLLDSARKLAKSKGRQIQALVEDALQEHLEAKNRAPSREYVMAAYIKSTGRFSGL